MPKPKQVVFNTNTLKNYFLISNQTTTESKTKQYNKKLTEN